MSKKKSKFKKHHVHPNFQKSKRSKEKYTFGFCECDHETVNKLKLIDIYCEGNKLAFEIAKTGKNIEQKKMMRSVLIEKINFGLDLSILFKALELKGINVEWMKEGFVNRSRYVKMRFSSKNEAIRFVNLDALSLGDFFVVFIKNNNSDLINWTYR